MLISCGAALFGLRLAVRSLWYQPTVQLLPDPARLRLLARVKLGRMHPMTDAERQMLEAVPHRHTHRSPFSAGPLPDGLLAGLQHDALTEGSTLALVYPDHAYQQLADIVSADAASRWVSASLYTQPLEAAAIRTLIRDRLALPGTPQMLLQLGRADSTQVTARRAPVELIDT